MLHRVRKAVATRGIAGTLVWAFGVLYRRIVPRQDKQHPFDREHETDTSGFILPGKLTSEHENVRFASAYYGTHPSFFMKVIETWGQTLSLPMEYYRFFDIGCGKGRVLMLASEFPFQSIVGIDLSEPLVEAARNNISLWLRKPRITKRIEAICADALTLDFGSDPVVLYLYNPFDAKVMKPFAEHIYSLSQARANPIDVLYVTPEHEDLLLELPGIHQLARKEISFSTEEIAVHAFEDNSHHLSIFRLQKVQDEGVRS